MAAATHMNKFYELRKKFPFFSFEDFDYRLVDNQLIVRYYFKLSDNYCFRPTLQIPIAHKFFLNSLTESALKNLLFHIGMVELISYWKLSCPEKVIIRNFKLNENQLFFWRKLYFNGLGEFFYVNGIKTDEVSFMDIICESDNTIKKETYESEDSNIILVGGGKDSVVSLEVLKTGKFSNKCLIVNPRKASIDTVINAGIEEKDIIKVNRSIDPLLLELNDKGFLNGHTPFSALLAFVSVLVAALYGRKNIVLSNESSANEATVKGSSINHQYTKSYEFEKDVRTYIFNHISEEINYFSLLRPLNELQIAKIFSSFRNHFYSFRSCNAGSKADVWCCKCAKCLFTYIILSPFIPPEELQAIYGSDILNDRELLLFFRQLTGEEEVKPFECVGTVDEVNIALHMTLKKYFAADKKLPYLLQYYNEHIITAKFPNFYENEILKHFNPEHFLNSRLVSILKKYI